MELDNVALEVVDVWDFPKPYRQLFRLEKVEKVEWTFAVEQVLKRLRLSTLALPVMELLKHLASIVGRLSSGGQCEVVQHVAVPHHLEVGLLGHLLITKFINAKRHFGFLLLGLQGLGFPQTPRPNNRNPKWK